MAEFNLNSIYKKAFGYAPPNDKKFEVPQADVRLETSQLGQPYYGTDLLGREFFLPVKLNDYLLPFAVLSITTKKTIVNTAMPERGGTVKELVSIDDYIINVKGLFINDTNDFPEQQIIELHDLFLINQSVTLRSVLTDIFLKGDFDHQVVIREIKYPPTPGVEHVKAFDIDMESDMIFTLEID